MLDYDIRTKDKEYQKKLEDENGVKMTDEDEAFYTDNCMESYKATCSYCVYIMDEEKET